MTRVPKVVVCGTGFGRVYLAGITAAASRFELAGILARGSERSQRCAERYGTTLYRTVDALPDDVDIGCVVTGSAPTGGPGARLAEALMERGVHVMQEHPLHTSELTSCLRAAQRNRVHYEVNAHHRHVPEVRRFTSAARRLLRQQPALFIDATASFQTLYSLLDILTSALGSLRPWGFTRSPEWPASLRSLAGGSPPYRTLEGLLARIPATLRIQHQVDPAQPDNHVHLWHRITIGTEGGNLTLVSSGGPTLWCSRPHLSASASSLAGYDELTEPYLGFATAEAVGPATAPDWMQLLTGSWPEAVRTALDGFWASAEAGAGTLASGQSQLGVCQLTAEILELLGPVELTAGKMPQILTGRELVLGAESA